MKEMDSCASFIPTVPEGHMHIGSLPPKKFSENPADPHRTPQSATELGGFEKGLAGGGLATNKPPKRGPKVLQKCVPILLRGHRKKGTEKRPESLAFAPVRQPLRNF